ncbi:fimbrial biogenesis outer membrane usher protein [Erwinia rhapontici]|uniref:fimbria/pilus outer membrane usher protein n=1 Tax=Erwinia rhapontici TaxID=55212 RepID=UPI001D0DBCDF|nr:fimbria/pilus outer membrane usher protein [Erwinia rhapontici]UDQ78997.1 fimbrial biogenesis outer membrane usher protein [Erwinia rhapontici]
MPRTRRIHFFCYSVSGVLLAGVMGWDIQRSAFAAPAEGYASFDINLLRHPSDKKIDVTQFNHRHALPPGAYDVGVMLNNKYVGYTRLQVKKNHEESVICTTRSLINLLPLKPGEIDSKKMAELDDADHCRSLDYWVPSGQGYIDVSTLQMIVTVPQVLLMQRAQNEVDPAQWDGGVNALILGYNANYYQSKQDDNAYRSFYNGDNIGLNLWGFMFRHRGSMNWQNNSGTHYQSLRNYMEHGISALRSRIIIGDTDTSGHLFDSFSLRGVLLYSDDNMLPDSRRGYAPMIRGVAETNARISVRQNNVLLYETTVSPGPFSIDDLYPTGYGGDLTVTIRESDGRESQFMVPYAAVPQLVRPGLTKYSLTAGTLRNMNLSKQDAVAQLTLQRGINNLLTGYGGVLTTRDYHAFLLGGAIGSSWGALALDVTQAQTDTQDRHLSGQSYRATYSKGFNASSSTMSLSAWRFSSPGYLGLNDAMSAIDYARHPSPGSYNSAFLSPRSRLSASLAQGFPGKWGQLYLTAIRQSYWGSRSTNNQLQAGYSNTFGSLSWSLSVNRVNGRDGEETQYTLGLSVPLGGSARHTYLNMNVSHDAEGMSSQASINSTLGAEQQFDYALGLRHDSQQRASANLAANWHTRYTSVQGSVEQGRHSQSWSGGLSGALVALPDGVVTSPWYSETMALVDAPNAYGARVEGHSGLTLNPQGRALVPYLRPYRLNEITLDPQGLPTDIELKSTRQQTAPHTGALVKVNFATSRGRAVLIHSTLPDGKSLPFGAVVQDEQGNHLGLVAQGDLIYVRLPPGRSHLQIKSGDTSLCSLSLQLSPHATLQNGFEHFSQPCLPLSAH